MPELKKKRWRTTLQRSRGSRQRSTCSARYPKGYRHSVYCQQRAAKPDPARSNSKKVRQTAITLTPDWMGSSAL
jgi:hypothetical protein